MRILGRGGSLREGQVAEMSHRRACKSYCHGYCQRDVASYGCGRPTEAVPVRVEGTGTRATTKHLN